MISADVDGGSGGGGDGFFAVLLLLPLAPLAVPLAAAAAAAAASPCPLLFFFLAMLLVICCPSLRVTLEAWPEGAVARLARIIYTPRSGQPPPATCSRLRLSFAPHPPPTTTLHSPPSRCPSSWSSACLSAHKRPSSCCLPRQAPVQSERRGQTQHSCAQLPWPESDGHSRRLSLPVYICCHASAANAAKHYAQSLAKLLHVHGHSFRPT